MVTDSIELFFGVDKAGKPEPYETRDQAASRLCFAKVVNLSWAWNFEIHNYLLRESAHHRYHHHFECATWSESEHPPTPEDSLKGLYTTNIPFDVLTSIIEQVGMVRKPDFVLLKGHLRDLPPPSICRTGIFFIANSSFWHAVSVVTPLKHTGWRGDDSFLDQINPHISALRSNCTFPDASQGLDTG
jgi:hypothetical protein